MKMDFKEEFRSLYTPPSDKAQLIEIPPMQFLMLPGEGDPGHPAFQEAIQAIYSCAYSIKVARQKAGIEPDYTMGPLEAQWWITEDSLEPRQPEWKWRLMLWQPGFVTPEMLAQACAQLKIKKPGLKTGDIVVETLAEGAVVQTMHLGPYSTEAASITKLQQYASDQGYKLSGRHHEIYLSDPRRVEPSRLRTILRHPVIPA